MNSSPTVSIITITYNASATLLPTLESLREQTCKDFEHIIVDGASSDDTLDIARRHGLPEARILSEPDKGLYDAMNKGLRLAKGEYVLFLNAGDALFDKETLSLYVAAAKSNDVDIIYGDTLLVDSERRVVGKRHLSVPERLTRKSFSHGMLICHQAFMVRKSLAPCYDTSYRFSADYDWTVKCISATTPDRCINLHTTTIAYLTDGLTDRNHTASLKERYHIMARHYGTLTAVMRHIGFIPRVLRRRLTGK